MRRSDLIGSALLCHCFYWAGGGEECKFGAVSGEEKGLEAHATPLARKYVKCISLLLPNVAEIWGLG